MNSWLLTGRPETKLARLRNERMLIIGIIMGAIMMLLISLMTIKIHSAYYESKMDDMKEEYNAQLELKEKEYQATLTTYTDRITELENEISVKNNQITKLEEDRTADFATLQKYWYVFKEANSQGGVTTDLIVYADQLGQEKDINPHLAWAIIDVESDYTSKIDSNRSTARGLGQFLESTARSIYENYLGHGAGTYNHSLAYDPYVNMDLIFEYLRYLKESYNGDIYEMLRRYSGSETNAYYTKVNNEMSQYGHDILKITY